MVQTLELTQQMMNMYAGKRKIDAVVLSGGASRMPVVEANAGENCRWNSGNALSAQ